MSTDERMVNPPQAGSPQAEEEKRSVFGFWKQAVAFIFLILMSYDVWEVVASIVQLGQYFTFELSHWLILGGLLIAPLLLWALCVFLARKANILGFAVVLFTAWCVSALIFTTLNYLLQILLLGYA